MRTICGDIRVPRSVQSIALMLVLLASLMAGSAPAAKAQSPNLFADAGPVTAADGGSVMRSRLVSVNLDTLLNEGGGARSVSAIGALRLNLFPDATYTGAVTELTNYDADTHAWSGTLKEVAGGYFYLVISGGAFLAHVASTQGVYEVSWAGDDLYRVIQIDQSKMVDEPPGGPLPAGNSAEPMPVDPGMAADSASRIDVMILYTDDARIAEGGTAAMKARVALAVTEANTSYANAGITPRLRLVHTEEVLYTETDFSTDLGRLQNPSDGYMDQVPVLRDTYGADMVQLVVAGTAYCGIGYMMDPVSPNFAPYAYSLVSRDCMTGYYSTAHEMGHNMGARHDMYVDTTLTPFDHGHGYVHTGSTAATRWRTVMAYNNKCASLGYNCTRLQYFSNPTKYYGGVPMGTASRASNYLVLNSTAATVANFRHQVIGENFSSSFNTSSSGWSALIGPWALYGGAYYKSTGVANHGSSAVHSGNYGDLTYTVRMKRTGGFNTLSNRIIIRGYPAEFDETMWWEPSYVFQYNNAGTFSVYHMDSGGALTSLVGWTASSAIVPYGWNTLRVIAADSTLRYYINGTLVWIGSNPSLDVGAVGFGYYRDGDAGTLYVDSASLTTTPTAADMLPGEAVAPGVPLSGGDLNQGP